jgi:predicted Zn-dependent protease
MSPTTQTETSLVSTPLTSILSIPNEVLDQAMAMAYQLYRERRYEDAEIMCRGLLAADPTYWWSYSLYAATLQKLGRVREALTMVTLGLRHEPNQPKLVALRDELEARIARVAAAFAAVKAAKQGGATKTVLNAEVR